MSITPQDFIRSAEKLLEEDLEINYRNAGSRAYQGAHHACRQLRERLNLGPLINVPEREGCHKKLIRSLQQTPLPLQKGPAWHRAINIRQLGHLLSSVRDLRHGADYGLEQPFTRQKAQQLVLSSQIIVNQVNQLLDHSEHGVAKPQPATL
ncbi:MAG: hypothetical protein HQL72_00470 [Magnetococcales bacterium]|nr:hypothetical protein [Magnetococcales bacterium]